MATILRNEKFKRIGNGLRPDSKRRVHLPKEISLKEDIIYHVYVNSDGQIVLDPQVTISASEAWVFQNPEILELAKRGLNAAADGRISKIDLDNL